ncbi:hypothetical protein AVEN_28560-1 [Araneus ventricosus]|uniref:Uncharacterized protein n=1 Tax=Araneus ventricosus TaxID=182803 RepID=A0A4Y2L714_ARAVE|nr:hypothetical protein AVEN_28560-1 [Araneus ventricosus]
MASVRLEQPYPTNEGEEIDDDEGSVLNQNPTTSRLEAETMLQSASTGLKCERRQMQHRSYFCAEHRRAESSSLKDSNTLALDKCRLLDVALTTSKALQFASFTSMISTDITCS